MKHFDAIIIGTGQAGPSLAGRFSDAGMTVAIIERNKFGGTCVNTGCIPTKTMVASAYAAHVARRGDEYGFPACDVRIDMKRVKARKDEISGQSKPGASALIAKLFPTRDDERKLAAIRARMEDCDGALLPQQGEPAPSENEGGV